jgi:outer membrane protein OmpA-like peptidoglycan-associated protein
MALISGREAMSETFRKMGLGLAAAVLVLSTGIGGLVAAEQPSANQILNALKPKPLTRSLSGAVPAATQKTLSADDQKFIDSLRTKRTRSLSAGERERVATIAKERPSIDLEINFEYNSATISRKALSSVTELGKALANPELKGGVFLVAGHTEGKGGDEYNQGLSERRAEAIKRYLMEKFNLQAENLVAIGYGKTQLKNSGDPFAEENRRVQVVNMEASKEARN